MLFKHLPMRRKRADGTWRSQWEGTMVNSPVPQAGSWISNQEVASRNLIRVLPSPGFPPSNCLGSWPAMRGSRSGDPWACDDHPPLDGPDSPTPSRQDPVPPPSTSSSCSCFPAGSAAGSCKEPSSIPKHSRRYYSRSGCLRHRSLPRNSEQNRQLPRCWPVQSPCFSGQALLREGCCSPWSSPHRTSWCRSSWQHWPHETLWLRYRRLQRLPLECLKVTMIKWQAVSIRRSIPSFESYRDGETGPCEKVKRWSEYQGKSGNEITAL